MKIKGKPDLTGIPGAPARKADADSFIYGAASESKPASAPAEVKPTKPAKVPKRQKLVELPEDVFAALKDRAYQEYKATGQRVTETQIIIEALRKHLGLITPFPIGDAEDFLVDQDAVRKAGPIEQ